MENKLLSSIVMATIGVILIGTMFAPVVSSQSQSFDAVEKSHENVLNYMSLSDSFTFTQEANTYTVELDGEAIDLARNQTLLVTDEVIITGTVVSSSITTNATMAIYQAGESPMFAMDKDITVELADGTLTITVGTDTVTSTPTYAYIYDEDGDYALIDKAYVSSINVNTNDEVILFLNGGWWTTTYMPVVLSASSGTKTLETDSYAVNTTTSTDAEISVVLETQEYDHLQITSCTPSTMSAIVPASYTDYETSTYTPLLSAMIVIFIAALVIAAVGIIAFKR